MFFRTKDVETSNVYVFDVCVIVKVDALLILDQPINRYERIPTNEMAEIINKNAFHESFDYIVVIR